MGRANPVNSLLLKLKNVFSWLFDRKRPRSYYTLFFNGCFITAQSEDCLQNRTSVVRRHLPHLSASPNCLARNSRQASCASNSNQQEAQWVAQPTICSHRFVCRGETRKVQRTVEEVWSPRCFLEASVGYRLFELEHEPCIRLFGTFLWGDQSCFVDLICLILTTSLPLEVAPILLTLLIGNPQPDRKTAFSRAHTQQTNIKSVALDSQFSGLYLLPSSHVSTFPFSKANLRIPYRICFCLQFTDSSRIGRFAEFSGLVWDCREILTFSAFGTKTIFVVSHGFWGHMYPGLSSSVHLGFH